MPKQSLPNFVIDQTFSDEILAALKRANARGIHPVVAFGTLMGVAVGQGFEAEAQLADLHETATIAWYTLKQLNSQPEAS
jgi:hypothetical protein